MIEPKIHEGRNVNKIRNLLGVKQETLAAQLGLSQQAISALEQKEVLDKETLEKVAKALKVSPEAIRTFSEETAVNIISNNFNSHDTSTMNAINYYPSFNPLDKMVELYEALLKSEREKIELLQRLTEKK